MSTSGGIVIVGGGLAAARTAEQLRRSEYTGAITIVSDEDHLPYDRPPLSKEVLRAEVDDVTLKPAEFYEENDITVLLGNGARSVDTAAQSVTLADGSELGYDELIIATGLVPKTFRPSRIWKGSGCFAPSRRAWRCVSMRVRRSGRSSSAPGFIGCEVAASLRGMGVNVVLVEPQPTPLASVLGEQIGALVSRLHRAEGVDVRCDVGVAEVRGTDNVEQVVLSDGTELDADLVVVGIGSTPATEWLEDSGVELNNGVVCDDVGRTGTPHVWAIGDVASWRHPVGHQVRVEHWSNVADQARVLVPAMLGKEIPATVSVPYFWSDQYDVKIQCLGEPQADDTVHVVADDGRKFLAFYERDGVVAGVVGGGMPGKVMKVRTRSPQAHRSPTCSVVVISA